MDITLTLGVDDDSDVDSEHSTGLTGDAYDRLMDALMNAGFSIVSGPDAA